MPQVLYWPGRGKSIEVLHFFREFLVENGVNVSISPFVYDEGCSPFEDHISWTDSLKKMKYDWWIGISLGASVCYSLVSLLEPQFRPERLTLINPFASRRVLAEEKGFSLASQWDFSPIEYPAHIDELDIVLSLKDDKIPSHHGLELMNTAKSQRKRLILIDSDHCIDEENAQKELASVLMDRRKVDDRKYIHCDLRDWL